VETGLIASSGTERDAGLSTTASDTERKIAGFRHLRAEWHYRTEGRPIEPSLLERALRLHKEATRQGFERTDAFPGLHGEVMLTVYDDANYLEFVIETDGTVDFVLERDGVEIAYLEGLSMDRAIEVLQAQRKTAWMLSGSFIRSIMTPRRAGSRASASSHIETASLYRSSAKTASSDQVGRFASISGPSMRKGNQSSFGGFPPIYCQAVAG